MRPTDLAAPPSAPAGASPRWNDVLRALREARGVTQGGWAARIGVSRATVQRWEAGSRVPDPGAEAAIVAFCRERDLFRPFARGPLAGLDLTPDLLHDLLADARLGAGRQAMAAAGAGAAARDSVPLDETPSSAPGPAPAPSRAGPSNLPVSLTSFVGREAELAAVRRVLGGTRLLTLTGAGGCGKTRLALQVAGELVWAYPHGVWLVELAALADPALVAPTVADALGLGGTEPRPPLETLADSLRGRSLLLLLDNCEHLLEACAALAETLLRACPHLEVLATSREPLGVPGETLFRVPPLSVEAPGEAGDGRRESGPGAGDSRRPYGRVSNPPLPDSPRVGDAVALFVARARLQRPAFALDGGNGAAVAEICRRLDGMPLAIELAAARVNVLSAGQIAARLADRFRLLTGGGRAALPRHQTLRAAMAWSYDLLAEPERALLRALSVFAGGFTLEAAEAVCADLSSVPSPEGGGREGGPDVLDLLGRLVDKSLVVAEERDAGSGGAEVRYRLLETVRQFAAEQLAAAGEAPAVRERHAAWCLALAETAWPHRGAPERGAWLERLSVEHDNLRAALDWYLAGEHGAAAGLWLGILLWWFWEVRGHLGEGRRWLAALLARGDDVPSKVRAEALDAAGTLAQAQGDFDAAAHLHEQSLALWRGLGDESGIADALNGLGNVANYRNDLARARALFEESLEAARTLGDPRRIALSLNNLGIVTRQQGEPDRAAALYEESLALAWELGHTSDVARTLLNLGNVHRDQGLPERAEARYRESLSLFREMQNPLRVASCLQGMAAVAVSRGDAPRAARLAGAADALRAALAVQLPAASRTRFDQAVAAARAALGEAAFAAAWAAGQALSLEQAIAEALDEPA